MKLFPCVALAAALAGSAVAADSQGYIKARGGPADAGVFVDDKYVGPASRFTVPEKYPVDPGEHTISFRDPRYEEYSTKVTVTAGKTTKLRYKLKKKEPPKPPFGRIRFGGGAPESFMSVVAGDTSAVYLNGAFWGYIDQFNNPGGGMLVPPGTYEVRVSSPVHGEINQKVTVEANKLTIIPLKGGGR